MIEPIIENMIENMNAMIIAIMANGPAIEKYSKYRSMVKLYLKNAKMVPIDMNMEIMPVFPSNNPTKNANIGQ